MPLRSNTAIPIVPKAALESFSVTIEEGVEKAVATELTLGVRRQRQQQTNWCWAACVDMVLDFYGEPSLKQCEVVGKKIKEDCCDNPQNSDYNISCEPEDMRAAWKQVGIKSHPHLGAATGDSGWIRSDELRAELDEGRPVELGLRWKGGGGHAIIVQGWKATSKGLFFLVNDPWDWTNLGLIVNGKGRVHYDELRRAYGMGKWKWTWTKLDKE